jgi:putative membrane protein insertion efficiency factor
MRSLWRVSMESSLLLIFLFLSMTGYSQTIHLAADLELTDSLLNQSAHHHEKRSYVYKDQPKTFANSNPVSLMYGGALYVYQNVLSQHFSADCLYDPSCSEFSKQAVKKYGLVKGTLLTFDRLSRCNRIAATGLSPGRVNQQTHKFNDAITRYK